MTDWGSVSAGVAVASAAFTALIADQLTDQRGAASAAVASSQAVGIVVGVGVIVLLGLGVVTGYLALAGFLLVAGVVAGIYWLVQQSSHLAWAELMFLVAGAAIFTLWVLAFTSPSDAGPIERRPR